MLVYLPGVASPFITLDDDLYVLANSRVQTPGWAGLVQVWSSGDALAGRQLEYFPLRDSINWALFQGFGTQPMPYHLVTIALHALATLLAWRLLVRLVGDDGAFLAAALFAVHPIHVESVAWISGLKDPLSVSLLFGSLLLFAQQREGRGRMRGLAALVLLVLSLLSKSMGVIAPLLLLAMDRLTPNPVPWRRALARASAAGAVSALFLLQFVLVARASGVIIERHGGGGLGHLTLMLWAQVRYLGQALVPATFRLLYCFEPPTGWGDVRLWAGVALVALIAALLWRWRAQPLLRLLVLWHFICLLPVSNLVPFPAVMADRYLYASSLATCALLAVVLEHLRAPLRKVVGLSVIAALALVTSSRVELWNREEELWAESDEDPACLVDPSDYAVKAHTQRALTATDPRVSLAALERAIASAGFSSLRPRRQCNVLYIAIIRASGLGATDDARRWAGRMTEVCPSQMSAWFALSNLELHEHPDAAIAAAERAMRLGRVEQAPAIDFAKTLAVLGLARLRLGVPTATEALDEALTREPRGACGMIRAWANKEGPERAAIVSPWLERCPKR
jgi:hypothetical protein